MRTATFLTRTFLGQSGDKQGYQALDDALSVQGIITWHPPTPNLLRQFGVYLFILYTGSHLNQWTYPALIKK